MVKNKRILAKRVSKKIPKRRRADSRFSDTKSTIISAAYVVGNWKRPLPQKIKSVTRYCELLVDINPGAAGAAAEYVYAANGLYDPNITGAGHQPLGYDQMIAIYERAVVTRAKITVCGWNSDASYPQSLLIYCSNATTTSTGQSELIENGNCAFTYLGPYGTSTSGQCLGEASLSFDAKKWFNKKSYQAILDDDTLFNTNAANPLNPAYFHISVAPMSASDTAYVRCSVVIEYEVTYMEPNKLAAS